MKLKQLNQKQSIGLHFDKNRLYGVRLKYNDSGAQLEAAVSINLNTALGSNSSVDTVKQVLNQLEVPKSSRIYVTTAFENFNTTHLSIAEAPLVQMNKMVSMAYQQELDLENMTFDYERVGTTADAVTPKVNLHAFAVETALKDKLSGTLSSACPNPVSLFPKLFAFRNLVSTMESEAPLALLIMDKSELRISVIHNHKFIFTRTFKSGMDILLDYISQKVDTPISEPGLTMALNESSDDYHAPLSGEVRSAFTSIMERMQQQIERAFKFYTGRLKLPPAQRILFHADSPFISKSMASALNASTTQPVEVLDLTRLDAVDIENYSLVNDDISNYTLAAGAALGAVYTCPNLLYTHENQQQQRKTYRIKAALMIALVTMAIICGVTFVMQVALLTPRILKKRTLQEELSKHPTELTRELMQAKTQLCVNRLHDLHELSEHYSLQGYFYEISSLMPEELKLEHLHMELYPKDQKKSSDAIGVLTLQGIVTDHGLRQQALLTKFLVELGSSDAFKNISQTPITDAERKIYSELGVLPFRINCELIYSSALAQEGALQ